MSNIQYTIRSIPTNLDQTLRHKSKSTGKSLNEIVIDTLERGAGVTPGATFNDLDWFIGGRSLSRSFEKGIEWLDSVQKEI